MGGSKIGEQGDGDWRSKEVKDHETGVGLVPSGVASLVEAGHSVIVETRAGEGSTLSGEESAHGGPDSRCSPILHLAPHLERPNGGRGILLGGVPGVVPGRSRWAWAHVKIIDRNLNRLRELEDIFIGMIVTLALNAYTILETLRLADLVIGGVLIPGASAPKLGSGT